MTADAATTRLTQIRVEIEQHETQIWLLTRERDELLFEVRRVSSQATREGNA